MSEKVDLKIPLLSEIKDITTYTQAVLVIRQFFSENASGIIQMGSSFIQYNRESNPQLKQLSQQRSRSIFEIVDLPSDTIEFLNKILKDTPLRKSINLDQTAGR